MNKEEAYKKIDEIRNEMKDRGGDIDNPNLCEAVKKEIKNLPNDINIREVYWDKCYIISIMGMVGRGGYDFCTGWKLAISTKSSKTSVVCTNYELSIKGDKTPENAQLVTNLFDIYQKLIANKS